MTQTDHVTVYNYWMPQDAEGLPTMSAAKATREAIAVNGLGELLGGTAEDVPIDSVDFDGHYRRVPTGWGELDQIVPDSATA